MKSVGTSDLFTGTSPETPGRRGGCTSENDVPCWLGHVPCSKGTWGQGWIRGPWGHLGGVVPLREDSGGGPSSPNSSCQLQEVEGSMMFSSERTQWLCTCHTLSLQTTCRKPKAQKPQMRAVVTHWRLPLQCLPPKTKNRALRPVLRRKEATDETAFIDPGNLINPCNHQEQPGHLKPQS